METAYLGSTLRVSVHALRPSEYARQPFGLRWALSRNPHSKYICTHMYIHTYSLPPSPPHQEREGEREREGEGEGELER